MTSLDTKLKDLPLGLTFDDVLIIPNESDVEPTNADTSSRISKNVKIDIPLVSSPMDRVSESAMCIAMAELGGLGILHRNMTTAKQLEQVKLVKSKGLKMGASIGPFDLERAKALDDAGIDVIIIDCAHGHNIHVIKSAEKIKKAIKSDLVVGNIATSEAAAAIAPFADGLRVGIGPGATCTTRIITGAGIPQLTAINLVAQIASQHGVPLIADGGIRYSGDIVKALAAGADTVMNGSLLAGTDESPGEIVTFGDKQFKTYRGMGSLGAITGTDRYGQSKREKVVPEGVEGVVPYKGPVADLIFQLVGGLKAGMGYVGANNIEELKEKARFIRVTPLGRNENHPHSMIQTKDQPNYQA